MKHRIVVLGAGYAGAHAAGRLARRLHPGDTEITVVNADPDFVERVRLHQVAAGQDLRPRPLTGVFAGSHVSVHPGWVTAVDLDRRSVVLTDREVPYDTLVYALGSAGATPGHHVASRPAALRLRERLRELTAGETVLVKGGGLTAIELSTELAESRPDLHVAISGRNGVGTWLSDRAQEHLHGVLDRLGVEVGAPADPAVTVWATGFSAHPIAAASGLTVAETGQIVVDRTMRSTSHPDVYAAGDATYAEGPGGKPLRMCCGMSVLAAWQAADAIAARLTGRDVPQISMRYNAQCISLGRRDGLLQFTDAEDRATSKVLTGRKAARFKEFVSSGATWGVSHPTVMMPSRRHHLRDAVGAVAGHPR
ncbi:NAD(P)/FAD-dependent oxidoreductase [Actinoplanes sp. M2I2]|uniref:NAD(P)/FAD-dependent oxidoreductase n=1 Tax=Actinoplanes sp. M2I2 TaxID=1734444 RepID=UPI002021447B|nr:FAD-dependent oxidoreductase [Actinoplanes sp. M2I2]